MSILQAFMLLIPDIISDWHRNNNVNYKFIGTNQRLQTLQWRHNERDGVSNYLPQYLFTQPFIQTQIKENIKAPRHWPLCGEFTGHWLILRTKGK